MSRAGFPADLRGSFSAYLVMEGKVPMPQLRVKRLCHTMTPDKNRNNPHLAILNRRSPMNGRSGRVAAVGEHAEVDAGASTNWPMVLRVSRGTVEKYTM